MVTNQEKLEHSGICVNMENPGNHRGILCDIREKLYKNKIFFVCRSNICVKLLFCT